MLIKNNGQVELSVLDRESNPFVSNARKTVTSTEAGWENRYDSYCKDIS